MDGIIYPESHYGRDFLVGNGLIFLLLWPKGRYCKAELELATKFTYEQKEKIELTPGGCGCILVGYWAENYKK